MKEATGGSTIRKMTNDISFENRPNGSKIVSRDMPFLRTVTFGVAVNVGSVNESPDNSGISHLIEHSVFKGTENFNSYELKKVIEYVGGTLNAFTSREYTLFYAKVPDFAYKQAFNVLYDLVSAPTFPEKEIELEKSVVLEEIAMYEDDPGDLASTNLLKALWGENEPYGRPIIGEVETVKRLHVEELENYYKEHYISQNVLLSVVGNLKACDMEFLKGKMDSLKNGKDDKISERPRSKPATNVVVKKRDLKQVNVSLAIPTVAKLEPQNYPLAIMSTILGGGMSSLLFEEIREKLGLVYSISSSNQSNKLGGYFTIDFSTSPNKLFDALEGIKRVLSEVPTKVSSYMDYGKKRLKGKLLTSTESTFSTMLMMVDDQFTLQKIRGIDEMIHFVEKVNRDDILKTFNDFFCKKWTLSAVGPWHAQVDELKEYEFEVKCDGSR